MKRITGVALALAAAMASTAFTQDTQISARAKGMGGSYTAFGDDPISIWQNPAGTATQTSKLALSYTSFVTYEFADGGTPAVTAASTPGVSQATLNDPQIQPSFLGLVVSLSDKELNHAFSFGFINPINLSMVWSDLTTPAIMETHQQSSRFRFGYAVDLNLVKSGKGWLTHIAVGGGIDWGSTNYESEGTGVAASDSESRFGFGVGILATVFSDAEGFSVDIGASYNGPLDFDFNVPTSGAGSQPVVDWPAEWSVGIAVYISRLKITGSVQGVLWEAAVEKSAVPGASNFEDTISFSAGIEYAMHASEKVTIFLRGGVRHFDAPWDDESLSLDGGESLAVAVDTWGLSIVTDEEAFTLGTVGAGIYWSEEGGKKRGFDFGIEFGGDKATIAVGYVHEF